MVGEYSCCAPRNVKRMLVAIGDATIGIAKLDRVFGELYNSKRSPDDVDGEEIVNLVSFYNYIPPDAVDVYAEALMEEYRKFYRDKEDITP
ncbi:MAG TPA: hypothetical protein EYP67_07570 [Methanosarcinales archaeon]|nr:hypothetical protein [Methanosarcinales archaeon]